MKKNPEVIFSQSEDLTISYEIGRKDAEHDSEFIHRLQAKDGLAFEPSSLDEKTRSVEVTAATEAPSKVYDPARWEVVDEILLMDGAELPKDGSIPLTIEHTRHAGAVIGSFRDIRVTGRKMMGRVYFASSEDAEPYYVKVKEGHLNRFSITYPVDDRDSVYIGEGESSRVNGKNYKGPVLVTKRWVPRSLGLVIYAADDRATARSANDNSSNKETITMNKKILEFLQRHGLEKDASDEKAMEFLTGLIDKGIKVPGVERSEANTTPGFVFVEAPAPVVTPDTEAVRKEAAEGERVRISTINTMCDRFAYPVEMRDKAVNDGLEVEAVRALVMDHVANKTKDVDLNAHPATTGLDERDKFRSAAGDALMIRSGYGASIEKPAPGATDLQGYSMTEIARHSLRVAGQPESGRPLEMIGRAMTTSDFPFLMAAVANKSLFEGWNTAPETWPVWAGTGQVNDFKDHKSLRASEASDLDEIPEDTEYNYGKRTEAQETYNVVTYGKMFAISRQTVINDDLNALTNQPFAHGESAARKVGDVVYAVLTANAAMGDSIALFHASHSNLVAPGSGAGIGIATLAAGILAMGTQKDLQGLRRLNIRPEFVLAPKALEGASEVFFKSDKFSDTDTIATDSSLASTRVNPYSGTYFTRVYEPRLDDDDALQWYLAARKGKTVKVFFLDGVQAPYMETKQGWSVDGVEYKVRIDVGAKAMDWKGLYQNDGD